MVDLDYNEDVLLSRSHNYIVLLAIMQIDIPLSLSLSLSLFLIIQVIVAYQRKVEEMRNQGLNEEELDNKLELLKVSHCKLIIFFSKKMQWKIVCRGKAILTNYLKN